MCLVHMDEAGSVQGTEASFGEKVRTARRKRGWTQRELGAMVDLDASAISRLEAGTRAIRLGEASLIARALSEGLDELVFGQGPSPHAQLEVIRSETNELMAKVHYTAVDVVRRFVRIVDLLEQHDELFGDLPDSDEEDPPKSVDEYLEGVVNRTLDIYGSRQRNHVVVETEKRARQLHAIVAAITHRIVRTEADYPIILWPKGKAGE